MTHRPCNSVSLYECVCVFLRMYPLYPCIAFATEFIDFYTEEHHQPIPFSIPWPPCPQQHL